jgi:hypothetical protein
MDRTFQALNSASHEFKAQARAASPSKGHSYQGFCAV